MKFFRIFKTMVVNGLKGVWRNKNIGIVSTFSIVAVLLILGTILLSVLNVNSIITTVNKSLDKVVVYLVDDITEEETDTLLKNMSEQKAISEVSFISKEQAIIDARLMFNEDTYVLSGLEKNPFPASVIIELNDLSDANRIVDYVKQHNGVEEIRYYKDLIEKILTIERVIKLGGVVAFIAIIVISIFIISNIIKMAILSRKNEIEIMKYIGASESFIKGPFVVEGVFYAMLGAVVAYAIIYYGYRTFVSTYTADLFDFISFRMVQIKDIYLDIAIIFGSIGIGIGTIGSLLSIRKYLKV